MKEPQITPRIILPKRLRENPKKYGIIKHTHLKELEEAIGVCRTIVDKLYKQWEEVEWIRVRDSFSSDFTAFDKGKFEYEVRSRNIHPNPAYRGCHYQNLTKGTVELAVARDFGL